MKLAPRRRATAMTMAVPAARLASVAASPPHGPRYCAAMIGSAPPSARKAGRCRLPITLPAMKKASAISIRPAPLPAVYSVPDPQPLASCMPMPNTNAPMTSEGPSGAIAPPKPGTRAATGTTATAATAISRKAPTRPPASPRTMNRRQAAVKLNSAAKNAMPSAKPSPIRAADAGCPSSSTSAHKRAAAAMAAERNSQSRRRAITGAEEGASTVPARAIPHVPKPSAFFKSSHLVRCNSTGRRASAVHSTIEPG